MNYNRLGNTDLQVSELGLGCQSLGGGLYYRDKGESLAMVRQALEAGVTFFDTADHYSQGLSEGWLGEALRGRRHDVVLATKSGTYFTPLAGMASRMRPLLRPASRWLRPLKIHFHRMRATQKRQDFSAVYLTRAVDASLRRLHTDYLDLFQLHKPPLHVLQEGEWRDALKNLQQQGKIRHYGISCASLADAIPCLDDPDIASVQVGISLLEQGAVPEFLARARQRSLGVIARNPRAQGHLTTDLHDIMAETYAKNREDVAAKTTRALQFAFLANPDRSLGQAALQFVLQLPGITCAIPRAVNVSQLLENLGALDAPPLSATELRKIATLG
ncbi:MAG: aldo/keto reductase [Gammaproteobacteria bacterium]